MKTLYYTVNKTVASCYYSFPRWCIHLYRCGAVYEHTKIRAVATAQVLRVITSLVWAKWHLRFCVSLLIRRRFSLRLRSRAEWSRVPPEADVGEAESRNKTVTLGKSQFYIAEISTERSAVCLCVVCLQCFYWLNNGVFLQYYTVKLRCKRELTTKQPTSSEACELLVSVPDCILTKGLMKAVLTQYGQMKGKINRNNTNEFHV